MTTDLDIFRCAWLMLRTHGADAAVFASERADAMLAKGDMAGLAIWKRIVRAIEELQQVEPTTGQRLN